MGVWGISLFTEIKIQIYRKTIKIIEKRGGRAALESKNRANSWIGVNILEDFYQNIFMGLSPNLTFKK